MNKVIEIDPRDMSAYSSSSIKSPVTILNEYAAKNNLVLHYNLIRNGSSLSTVSFKCSVNLDKFVAVGKGHSKQKAKDLAASNLLKKIINDNPKLLNTDFKECAISPYDKNIKVNNFFTKENKTIEVDQQDMPAYLSSSNKHPVAILNEYAAKNHLVHHYKLIHDGSSLSKVSFKYIVNLDKFVAVGTGPSKNEAKYLAASNLLKKIIDDKPQLLNTDFNEYAISPYDNDIKLNASFTKMNIANEVDQQDTSAFSSLSNKHPISILNEYATKNNLVPHYNLIHDASSLGIVSFKYSVNLDKFEAEGNGYSKREAKHLAASNLLKKIIDDKPQLLNTDFKEYAISPYDKNIKVNASFTKMNKSNEVDQQDMSAFSSSSNKHPICILNEYAAKNNLVLHYNLIRNGSSLSTVSFKYSVNLDKFVAVGEAPSKKEAKHLAASNLIKTIIDDKPQLLNNDFKEYTISPYDKNIKVNYNGQLDDLSKQKNIELPGHNLVEEEGLGHNKLFTGSCHAAKMIETATHGTKQQAKYLADFQMVNSLMCSDVVVEKSQKNMETKKSITKHPTCDDFQMVNNLMCSDIVVEKSQKNMETKKSMTKHPTCDDFQMVNSLMCSDIVVEMSQKNMETKKSITKHPTCDDFQMVNSLMCSDIVVEKSQKNMETEKSITKHLTCDDYHLVLKNTEWKNSDTLNMIVNQYIKYGKLDLPEPYNILKKIITEHKNMHITSRIEKIESDFNNYSYLCTFVLTDVYPNVYGCGVDTNSEKAQHIAVKELLINICILLK